MRVNAVKIYMLDGAMLVLVAIQLAFSSINMNVHNSTSGHSIAMAGTILTPAATPGLADPANGTAGTIVNSDGRVVTLPAAPPDNSVSSTPPEGVPAITPSISNFTAGTAAFTQQDVLRYIQANNTNNVDGLPSSVTPHIEKIRFLTENALQKLIPGYGSGWPGDTLMCYVQFSGSFTQSTPLHMKLAHSTYPYAYEVFNAHAGNILASGAAVQLR